MNLRTRYGFGYYVLLIGLVIGNSTQAAPIFKKTKDRCIAELSIDKISSTDSLWRKNPRDVLMALRANAPHFWAWAKQNAHLFFNKETLDVLGVVLGDIHDRNLGFAVLDNKVSDLQSIDLDDGGVGPFILDLANYIHRIKIAEPKIKVSEIVDAYIKGISQDKIKQPEILNEVQEIDSKELRKARKEKISKFIKIDKQTKVASFDYKNKEELVPVAEINKYSEDIQRNYLEDKKLLEASIRSDGYEVHDVAIRVKEDGGSQGIPRFVYLVKKAGRFEVIFFKQFGEPATSNYMTQLSHIERFKQLVKAYWPSFANKQLDTLYFDGNSMVVAGEYHAISNGKRTYLRAPKIPDFLEYDDTPDTAEEEEFFKEMTLFKVNFLGIMHGQQSSFKPLMEQFTDPEKQKKLVDQIKTFLSMYQEEVDRLQNTDDKEKK